MKRIYIVASAVIVLAVFLVVLWRVTDTCADVRCQLTRIMPRLGDIQRKVEPSIRIGVNEERLESANGISFGYITKDGSIIIVNDTSKIIVIARPTLVGDSFLWKCNAYPEKTNTYDLLSDCGKKFR